MKNKVINISLLELKSIREKLIADDRVFFVELNGDAVKTISDYLAIISKSMYFPIPSRAFDGYYDWMQDLSWINKDRIVCVINQYSKFLSEDIEARDKIISGFKDVILPWWENDVMKHVVNGKTKAFQVYLVE